MFRRNFIRSFPVFGIGLSLPEKLLTETREEKKITTDSREYWISVLTKIADPVLLHLSEGKLKANMPVEINPTSTRDRKSVTHLEAFGRLMAGMAPWLELGEDATSEGKLRADYILLTRKCIAQAVDPGSHDYMDFYKDGQALVDTAFLAHGLLRAPRQLWEPLDERTKQNVINALKSSRAIKPGYNNWLLFTAMVETFLLKINEEGDTTRIDFAIKKHMEWYKGDGAYGDGADFHWDYYNSYVIQPMLLDIVKVLVDTGKEKNDLYQLILQRGKRYAAVQERLISPEGTFPAIGRSLAYRFGAFQLLGQISLLKQLPEEIKPAQVRSALSSVISRMMNAPGTFDKNGWLQIGFCGHQPGVAEQYISTGSLYLCTVGLLPLGLAVNDSFWTAPGEPWTNKKIWSGMEVPVDHAI